MLRIYGHVSGSSVCTGPKARPLHAYPTCYHVLCTNNRDDLGRARQCRRIVLGVRKYQWHLHCRGISEFCLSECDNIFEWLGGLGSRWPSTDVPARIRLLRRFVLFHHRCHSPRSGLLLGAAISCWTLEIPQRAAFHVFHKLFPPCHCHQVPPYLQTDNSYATWSVVG